MIKLNLIGLAALFFSLIAVFAFKPEINRNARKFTCTLFVYNGGPENDPGSYSKAPVGFSPSQDCTGTDIICAICTNHTVAGGTQPDVNHTPLTTEITTVLKAPRTQHKTFTGGDEIWLKASNCALFVFGV